MRYFISILVSCVVLTALTNASSAQFIDAKKVVYDDRFYTFIDASSEVEILATDLGWAEGPVWAKSLNSLLFSDIAADKVYQWNETKGLSEFLYPSGHAPDNSGHQWRGANGLAIDKNGDLLLAQQSNRKVSRMRAPISRAAPDYEVLASHYHGKSINSPNDLAVHHSGDIYFTDPPYGLAGFEKSSSIEMDFFAVFRLTNKGELIVISRRIDMPNGIAFSNDHSTLYISNSAKNKAQIIAIELDSNGNPGNSKLFFDGKNLIPDGPGSTDGMAVHSSDYLFVSIPNGLGILSPKGELLGKIALGQITNMTFNDTFSQLFITSPNRLMSLKLNSVK